LTLCFSITYVTDLLYLNKNDGNLHFLLDFRGSQYLTLQSARFLRVRMLCRAKNGIFSIGMDRKGAPGYTGWEKQRRKGRPVSSAGEETMSEYDREKAERTWGDSIPDGQDEETDDAAEKTYRDGSLVNECWNEKQENV